MTSEDIVYCTGEQDVGQAMRQMGDRQLRRLPVVDNDKNLVGIVSLGDLAVRQEGQIDQTVRKVSTPDNVGSQL